MSLFGKCIESVRSSQKISFISGWHEEEKDEFHSYRWMRKNAVVEISDIENIGNGISYLIIVGGHPFLNTRNPILKVRLNGKCIGKSEILPRTNTYLFPVKLRKKFVTVELSLDQVFEKEKTGDPRELGMMVDSILIVPEEVLSSPIFTKGLLPIKSTGGSLRLVESGEIVFFNLKKEKGDKFVIFFLETLSELNDSSYLLFIRLNKRRYKKFILKNGINKVLFPLRTSKNVAKINLLLKNEGNKGFEKPPVLVVHRVSIYSEKMYSLPISMELETTTYCDINPPCVMCYTRVLHTRGDDENKNLDEEVFERIQPYLRNFEVISLHGIGEPLMGKRLFAILDSIDNSKTSVQFNTNGLSLTESKSRLLIEKGLRVINFSIDAATAETYRKIRRVDFERVIANIRRLSELKKEMGSKFPVIEMNMTLMRLNLKEVIQFIKLAKELGAEIVHFGVLNKSAPDYEIWNKDFLFHYREQMLDLNSREFIETMREAVEVAKNLGIKLYIETPVSI
jgi:MoaA/NifB/PqqE/SkfB family radical SAM enzyme